MQPQSPRFAITILALVAGCATPPDQESLALTHPANPAAIESEITPSSPTLALAAPANSKTATTSPTLYTCPMHKQIVTNQPGTCPICKMQLIPKPSATTTHTHDHTTH